MSTERMREEFEAWYSDRECYNKVQSACWLVKEPCGSYTYRDPNEAWEVWQASREAIGLELPFLFPYYRQEVIEVLQAAGIRVKP